MWWRSVTLGCPVSKMMVCTLQRAASDRSLSNGQLLKPWTTVWHDFLCPAVTATHTCALSVCLLLTLTNKGLCLLPPAGGFRSLYHWEWCVELRRLAVGDLLHGNDAILEHEQPTDTWRSGERYRLTLDTMFVSEHLFWLLDCAVFQVIVCLLLTAAPWKSPGLWAAAGSTTPETDRPSRSFGLSSAPYTTELHNTTFSSGHVDYSFSFRLFDWLLGGLHPDQLVAAFMFLLLSPHSSVLHSSTWGQTDVFDDVCVLRDINTHCPVGY